MFIYSSAPWLRGAERLKLDLQMQQTIT